jgi:intein-encoded DNA endonuclease-like protein
VARPSPALSYVIGVETGDGFLNVKAKSYQYRIRLRAVDGEFVEAFNQAVSKVLGCRPHRLWKGEKTRETEVEFGSYLLHKFLSQSLDDLKPFIEHDKPCAAAFIRGFFDSEGSVAISGDTSASNTDLGLLGYVQELLRRFFRIETNGPHRGKRKGTILTRRGRSYVRNADCYSIHIVMRHAALFYNEIGLTIERKRIRLRTEIGRRQSLETSL